MAGGEGSVSPTLSEWLVVFLIVFSLIFEAVLHRFENWLNRRHQHLQSVVRVLYRELMVLGFVSFLFIIYQFISKPDKSQVLSFEFAHVFIFLLAVFYTLVVLSTMFISLRLSARWKKMEQLDLVKYLHLKEEYTRLRLRMHRHHSPMWRMFQWWFPNFVTLLRYRHLHEIMTFHDIRFQFIFYRKLPEHFRFSSFLRKIKSLTFIALVESHWTVLAIFLVVLLFDLLRRKLTNADDKPTDVVESAFIISAAILLAIIVQILAIKIRKVYWELTKHPRVYYEGVEPAAVAEELAAAEDRLEADRAKRRKSRSGNASEDLGIIADDEATDEWEAKEESPETELAEPMNPSPLKKSLALAGSPNPERASALVSGPPLDTKLSETETPLATTLAANASRHSENYGGRGTMASGSQHLSVGKTSRPENVYVASPLNHSIEIAYNGRSPEYPLADRPDVISAKFSENKMSRSSMGERPTPKTQPSELAVPPQFQDIAARHSLEISRTNVTAPKRVLDPTSQTSVALAAVAAARKRSIEMQVGPKSTDNGPDPEKKSIATPRLLSRLSTSRGASMEDDRRASGGDYVRASLDGRGKRGGRSIELVAAMPHDEIVERHTYQQSLNPDHDLEAGIPVRNRQSSPNRKVGACLPLSRKNIKESENSEETNDGSSVAAVNSFIRHKSLGFMNATILKNLEHQQMAQTMKPAEYPWIVKKLIPRLGRVASPVEKLFWFGSHKFFLWCVELTLYFSTVLTAAATASLALLLLSEEEKETTKWNIASFVLPPVTLLFVLLRIAGIIKKYIFILHNASLVPEAIAIAAIHKVSEKQKPRIRDDLSDLSGTETEREDEEAARERRRNLGRFFRSEAEVGNMPGIDPTEDSSNGGSQAAANRRAKKRRLALRLRKKGTRREEQQVSPVSTESSEIVPSK